MGSAFELLWRGANLKHKNIGRNETLLGLLALCITLVIVLNSVTTKKSLGDSFLRTENSSLINVLNDYFCEWLIVEDFGYQGIHRDDEIEIYEVDGILCLDSDLISYSDRFSISFPRITIDIVTAQYIEQFDRMSNPGLLGFNVNEIGRLYAKITFWDDSGSFTKNICEFYVLNDNEIIIEGDIHRYYKAVKK